MPALQLVTLVLDASGSMGDKVNNAPTGQGTTKAWQIEDILCRPLPEPIEQAEDKKAVLENCGLIARLQQSQRCDNIDLGVIRFDTKAEMYEQVLSIADWQLSAPGTNLTPPNHYTLGSQPFDLLGGLGGGTNITRGLEVANAMQEEWRKQRKQEGHKEEDLFVTILLMSDMLHNERSHEPVKVATEIKRTVQSRDRPQVLLAAVAFGDDADLDLMEQLASGKEWAKKTTDPVELRKFFLASASQQLR